MAQAQYPRPLDVSKASPVYEGIRGLGISSPYDQTREEEEDHAKEKKSVMSKAKDKAKGKVLKVKDTLKKKLKSKKDTETGEDEDEDTYDVEDQSLPETPTNVYGTDGVHVNNGKPLESFGVSQNTREHARTSKGDDRPQKESENSLRSSGEPDLISVPTDYSSPRASVDAVMPPLIIKPGPASDLGELSSSNLGEIPEKPKEEEKEAAIEAPDDQSWSSPSFGTFGDTTQDKLSLSREEKEMEGTERDSMSQELGDASKAIKFTKKPSGGITEQAAEESQHSFAKKVDKELPSDEASAPLREPEKDDGGESERFTGKANRELPSTDAAVTSRGSETERSLRDPDTELPVPQGAEFTDNMFSSYDADDLRRSTENSLGKEEPEETQGRQASGVSGRNRKKNMTPSNTKANFSRDDEARGGSEPEEEQEQFHDPELDETSLQRQTSSLTPRGEQEQFHDPELDESSLKKQTSSLTNESGEEKDESPQDADLELDEEEKGKRDGKGSWSSVTSALVSALGTTVGFHPSEEDTKSDPNRPSTNDESAPEQGKSWTQWATERTRHSLPPITPQNSTVEGLDSDPSLPPQSWISKAVGILYKQPDTKEDTIEEENGQEQKEEEEDLHSTKPDNKGVDNASDVFVQ